jgi:hypothetical protein
MLSSPSAMRSTCPLEVDDKQPAAQPVYGTGGGAARGAAPPISVSAERRCRAPMKLPAPFRPPRWAPSPLGVSPKRGRRGNVVCPHAPSAVPEVWQRLVLDLDAPRRPGLNRRSGVIEVVQALTSSARRLSIALELVVVAGRVQPLCSSRLSRMAILRSKYSRSACM